MYKNLSSIERKPRVNREDLVAMVRTIDERPPKPLSKAKVTIIRHSHQLIDYQSLVMFARAIVTGLVVEEIIADDSWSVLGRWNVDQRYRDEHEGEMFEVLIQELPEKRN